jgi:two-component system phosphate regulon response regulator PhoB
MARILIVDDEPEIREMVRFILEPHEFKVSEAAHAQEARNQLKGQDVDLILMDWMLPGRSGFDLMGELKKKTETRSIPIIMLTARMEEPDKIEGLESGADDYITKPFSPRELIARIRAVLRRTELQDSDTPIEVGNLRVDPISHRITANGNELELSPSEYRLLLFFMNHPERAFTRTQLLDKVWGSDVYVEERTVDVHIRRLRKTLAPDNYDQYIQTVRGVGYRFSINN